MIAWSALACCLLAAVVLATLSSLTAAILRSRLRAAGFQEVALEVSDPSLRGARIEQVKLARGWRARAEAVDVTYDVPRLLGARIRSATVSGLVVDLDLSETKRAESQPAAADAAPRSSAWLRPFPFESVQVESGTIHLHHGDKSWTVPFRARLQASASGDLLLEADVGLGGTLESGARLTAGGRIDRSGPQPTGDLTLRLEPFTWNSEDPAGQLALALLGMQTSGQLGIEGRVRILGEVVSPEVTVTLQDGAVARPDGSLSVTGIDGKLTLDSLSPPTTPGFQTITWQTARFGKLTTVGGTAVVALEPAGTVAIDGITCEMPDGGRLMLEPCKFDPRAPDLDLALRAEALDVGEWLRLLARERATATGTVSGRLAMHVRTRPELRVELGTGWLHADGGGRVQIRDAATVREMLEENAPAIDRGAVDRGRLVQDRIAQALEDFQYQKLGLDLITREDSGLTLRANMTGKGVKVAQELDLTVNFNGFDEVVALALGLHRGLGKAAGQLVPTSRPPKGDR